MVNDLFFSQAWWNGSYMIAAKPIKTLELHYNMIQCFFFQTGVIINASYLK